MLRLYKRYKPAVVFWVVYGGAVLILWLIFAVWVPGCRYRENAVLAKQNLHAVQLALERYAVDAPGDCYPRTIQEVVDAGYLGELPWNPFEGRPMRALPVGAEPVLGDFIYYARTSSGIADPATLAPDEILGYTLEVFY